MTREELLRKKRDLLIQLRDADAQAPSAPADEFAEPAPAAALPSPSFPEWLRRGVAPGESAPWYDTVVRSAGQTMTLGGGDELNGAVFGGAQYLGQMLPESMGGSPPGRRKSLMDLYRENRDADRSAYSRSVTENPKLAVGGNTLGAVATLPFAVAKGLQAAGPAMSLAESGPLAQYVGAIANGAKAGFGVGTVAGLGSTNADLTGNEVFGPEARAALRDIGTAGTGGAIWGGGIPAAAGAAGWVGRNVLSPLGSLWRGGYIKTTPEANRLIAKGADLTLGRRDPSSTFGRFEELAANKADGNTLARLRSGSDDSVRNVLVQEAGAPGATPPTRAAPVREQIAELKAGYSQGYEDILGGVRIQPEIYEGAGGWRGYFTDPSLKGAARKKGAFELAVQTPDAPASVKTRALAKLKDMAARNNLVPRKSGADVGTVEARAVHKLRSDLRDLVRTYEGREGDEAPHFLEIYKRALDFTDELLTGQLPPENAAKLRELDGSYRNFLAVQKASEGKAAFQKDGAFNPTQLLEVIRNNGSTPAFESLARDAHQVTTATYPLTGIQGTAGETFPAIKWGAPIYTQLANTSPELMARALRPAPPLGALPRAALRLGRAAEGAGMSPSVNATTWRTLLELVNQQRAPSATLAQDDLDEFGSPMAGR